MNRDESLSRDITEGFVSSPSNEKASGKSPSSLPNSRIKEVEGEEFGADFPKDDAAAKAYAVKVNGEGGVETNLETLDSVKAVELAD